MSRVANVSYYTATGAVLCVEGGGTHSRGAVYLPGHTAAVASATGGICNPSTNFAMAVASINTIWQQVSSQPSLVKHDTVLCLGCAGIVPEDVRSKFIAAHGQFKEVVPLSDGYAALIGGGGGKPCGMIVAGTGCAGHRLCPDGTSFQRDGWGWIGGDRGSGAWIGLRAVRHSLEIRDGLKQMDSLATLILPELGDTNAEIASWFNHCEPRDIAALARHVFTCADQGLVWAEELLNQAAAHLRSLFVSLNCAPDEPLYLAGSIAEALAERISEGMDPKPQCAECQALDGCSLVIFGKAPLEWSLTTGN